MLRQDYGTFRLFSGDKRAGKGDMFFWGLFNFFKGSAHNTLYFGLILAIIGLVCSVFASREQNQRKEEKVVYDRRWVFWLLCFCFFFYILVFHYLANLPISEEPLYVGVQMRFWMQGFILLAVFVGIGYHIVDTTFGIPKSVSMIIISIIIILQLTLNASFVYPLTHDNKYLLHYGEAQLNPLPPSSIYIAHGDYQQNSVMYLQQCEHRREDVDVIYLPYASYMWYNHSQLPLYTHIHWPGVVYHQLGSILHGEGGNAFNLTYSFSEYFILENFLTQIWKITAFSSRRG